MMDYDTQVYYFKYFRQFWASGPAAAVAVVAGSPFENIKTRMQSKHFPSAFSAAKFIYQHEGIRGFWTSTLTPLWSLTFSRTLGFIAYRKAKYDVDRVIERATGESPLEWVNTAGTYPNLGTLVCFSTAGAISGAVLTPLLTPFEALKNASQTAVLMAGRPSKDAKAVNRINTVTAAKIIVKQRGVLSLWKGFNLHLTRDVIGGAVYFGVYESCKQALGSYYGDEMKNTPWAIPLAGAICGISSWVVTYPIDTMKTRTQNQLLRPVETPSATVANAVSSAARAAAKQASKQGRWRGIEMVIVRTAIQNMIQMTAFEQVKVWIDNAKFKDGSTTLPDFERRKGRDRRIV